MPEPTPTFWRAVKNIEFFTAPFCLLVAAGSFEYFRAISDQERNAPKSRNAHDGENNTTQHRVTAAANPGNNIKLEQSDAAPIDSTDNCKRQSNLIKHTLSFLLSGILLHKSLNSMHFPAVCYTSHRQADSLPEKKKFFLYSELWLTCVPTQRGCSLLPDGIRPSVCTLPLRPVNFSNRSLRPK